MHGGHVKRQIGVHEIRLTDMMRGRGCSMPAMELVRWDTLLKTVSTRMKRVKVPSGRSHHFSRGDVCASLYLLLVSLQGLCTHAFLSFQTERYLDV